VAHMCVPTQHSALSGGAEVLWKRLSDVLTKYASAWQLGISLAAMLSHLV